VGTFHVSSPGSSALSFFRFFFLGASPPPVAAAGGWEAGPGPAPPRGRPGSEGNGERRRAHPSPRFPSPPRLSLDGVVAVGGHRLPGERDG